MSKEILISSDAKGTRVAVVKDGRLGEFYVEPIGEEAILGNIYIGKVSSVVPALGAAFVDIGKPKNGFLYLADAESLFAEEHPVEQHKHGEQGHQRAKTEELKEKQDVWVQVVKEPFGTKGARLSMHIGLPGRYLVLMPFDKQIGISRRIEEREERERLRQILEKTSFNGNVGFIVRTAALGKHRRDILRDADQLMKLWKNIKRFAHRKSAPVLIYKEVDLLFQTMRDYFTADIDCVLIDSRDGFRKMYKYAKSVLDRTALKKIRFYQGKEPLFASKKIGEEIEQIYGQKVLLKSGAYLVIEKTEGLIVIDVNSGKFKSRSDSEQTAYLVNIEAAKEIARQLRLRDYGGIIVIDFIDMEQEKHRRHVLETLKGALESDRAKTDVLGISKLGLIEMTRERAGKPVEASYFKVCPYCGGSGKIKNN